MKIYNTLTRRKQEFVPQQEGVMTMYNCGPTVYNFAHIGNLSAYLMADLIRRVFEYMGYEVKQVKNITDVGHMTTDADEGEDKMEKAAREQKKDPYEIARFYEEEFKKDELKLRIKPAHIFPRATEYIAEMIDIIEKLIENGHAYVADDGVYFDIISFPKYGSLSGNTNLDELQAGARVDVNEHKKHPLDFALWKLNQPNHIMQWDSPWGVGYPGWHIECSAMSTKCLETDTIDIHTGGQDNIFPHHECEIAQCEGANGKPFVSYWIHKGYLNVEGKKMSKSLGNFYTLKDLEDKYEEQGKDRDLAAVHFRYLVMSSHYRSSVNFSFKGMDEAKAAIDRLEEFYRNMMQLPEVSTEDEDKQVLVLFNKLFDNFNIALNDDLNTPEALAQVFGFIKGIYRLNIKGLTSKTSEAISGFFHKFNEIFDVLDLENLKNTRITSSSKKNITNAFPEEIWDYFEHRVVAKRNKDYGKADNIRMQVEKLGYIVTDDPNIGQIFEINRSS